MVSNGFIHSTTLILAGLLVSGCAEEPAVYSTDIVSAQVQGSFLAPDGSDPDGIWLGSEVVEAYGAGGFLCSREWQMEAIEVTSDSCSDCSVALEVIASVGESVGSECSDSLDGLGRVHYEMPLVGYAPGAQFTSEGTIYLLAGEDASWDVYSDGEYDGEELFYVRSTISPQAGVQWLPLSGDEGPEAELGI